MAVSRPHYVPGAASPLLALSGGGNETVFGRVVLARSLVHRPVSRATLPNPNQEGGEEAGTERLSSERATDAWNVFRLFDPSHASKCKVGIGNSDGFWKPQVFVRIAEMSTHLVLVNWHWQILNIKLALYAFAKENFTPLLESCRRPSWQKEGP